MSTRLILVSSIAAATVFSAGAALAQTPYSSTQQPATTQQERIGAVLGALFGDRLGATTSLDTQWNLGRQPLLSQQAQFDSRIDADLRSGALNRTTGARLKSDFAALVALETRYGADRRFTAQERSDLSQRYEALTRIADEGSYNNGDYDNGGGYPAASISASRAEFEARVDTAVSRRRLSRTEASRIKVDYAALISVEAGYLRDGRIDARERADLDARLDALDSRVGDVGYGGGNPVVQTPEARLDAIARALPSSGLSSTARAQLRVEHEDLTRLATAYARLSISNDDRTYLDRRLTDLETRARIRR